MTMALPSDAVVGSDAVQLNSLLQGAFPEWFLVKDFFAELKWLAEGRKRYGTGNATSTNMISALKFRSNQLGCKIREFDAAQNKRVGNIEIGIVAFQFRKQEIEREMLRKAVLNGERAETREERWDIDTDDGDEIQTCRNGLNLYTNRLRYERVLQLTLKLAMKRFLVAAGITGDEASFWERRQDMSDILSSSMKLICVVVNEDNLDGQRKLAEEWMAAESIAKHPQEKMEQRDDCKGFASGTPGTSDTASSKANYPRSVVIKTWQEPPTSSPETTPVDITRSPHPDSIIEAVKVGYVYDQLHCFKCGSSGHQESDCTIRRVVAITTTVTQSLSQHLHPELKPTFECERCHRNGHDESTCTVVRREKAQASMEMIGTTQVTINAESCTQCFMTGHKQDECPELTHRGMILCYWCHQPLVLTDKKECQKCRCLQTKGGINNRK